MPDLLVMDSYEQETFVSNPEGAFLTCIQIDFYVYQYMSSFLTNQKTSCLLLLSF